MKINLICSQCASASGDFGAFFVETIREDGLYTGKCPFGHDILIATQTLRHEMLFEIALNAIKDGYNREAVSSFAASVERFFEFAIRVLARKNKNLLPLVFADAWKELSRQSERQLGAYVSLYSVNFGEVPRLLKSAFVTFRNDVIHNGILPDKRRTIEFGEAAYEVIQSGIKKLRSSCLDDVNGELSAHVSHIAEKMGTQYPRSFQITPTALNVIEDITNSHKPFSQVLAMKGISC